MDKIKVLIADDMEMIAMQTKSHLEKNEDIEIVGIANNGEEEINKIHELKPDLVFTDNQMPLMNGIDVIELVYNSTMENKPEFVLVTGDRDMELFNRANKCQVVRILNKPVDGDKILEAVKEYKSIVEMKKNKQVEEKKSEKSEEEIKKEKISFLKRIKKFLNS